MNPETPLNPKIARLVAQLNADDFETVDSGDGQTHDFECDQPFGYVAIAVVPSALLAEANRLRDRLIELGVVLGPEGNAEGLPSIQASYDPVDGTAFLYLSPITDDVVWPPAPPSFLARVIAGTVADPEKAIDDEIDLWHTKPGHESLSDFLGFTEEEYCAWLEKRLSVAQIAAARTACRRCTECEGETHHWMPSVRHEADHDEADWSCKHCPHRCQSVTCEACDEEIPIDIASVDAEERVHLCPDCIEEQT